MNPIFIAWTRSFWLGLFPAILTAADVVFALFADPAAGAPVANLLAFALGFVVDVSATQVHATMLALAPVYAIIVGQQRAGSAAHPPRPYTIDPRALQ